MKIFCVHCGAGKEVDQSLAGATFVCASCGKTFSLQGNAPAPMPMRMAAPPPPSGGSNSGAIGVVIVLAVLAFVAVIGVLAAIAIPNFLRFQSRSKQAECKVVLKQLYTAQRVYFAEHDAYTTKLADLDALPERGNRYAYFLNASGTMMKPGGTPSATDVGVDVDLAKHVGAKSLAMTSTHSGVEGTCPDCDITITCAGNIDRDDDLDVWTISTEDRPGARAGQPLNERNDLE